MADLLDLNGDGCVNRAALLAIYRLVCELHEMPEELRAALKSSMASEQTSVALNALSVRNPRKQPRCIALRSVHALQPC
jgi:hypothetical protein